MGESTLHDDGLRPEAHQFVGMCWLWYVDTFGLLFLGARAQMVLLFYVLQESPREKPCTIWHRGSIYLNLESSYMYVLQCTHSLHQLRAA